MTEHLSKDMSAKLDRMIAAGRFTISQMMRATGAKEDNIKQRKKRRNRLLRQGDKGGQIVVPPTSTIIEGAGPDVPECPPDVPLTQAGVRAELRRGLTRLKEMERALQDDGPQAMPAITALLGEQRKTIEAILKAEVVFANMPNAGAEETPQQRRAEARAYLRHLLDGAPPEFRDWLLKAMTEPGQKLRHRETETPAFSGQGPENHGDCRKEEPK